MINTIGGVVTPAEKLISIVPKDSPLIVKVNVLNQDIGFVKNEMNSKIKIDTFSFQKYGFFEGKIINVGNFSIDDEKLDRLEQQQTIRETDIELAINVMGNVNKQWAVSEIDLQVRFQSMLFPRGAAYDSTNHKFGTSEISELYRCISIEKAPGGAKNSYLVAQVKSNWNLILEELSRWKQLSRGQSVVAYSTV